MKSFSQFISEATLASQEAQRFGLVGDGHGGWYDRRGEFIAKTFGDKLKYYNKRQKPGQDPKQTEKERNVASSLYNDPALGTKKASSQSVDATSQSSQQGSSSPVEQSQGTLTVVFGRFNPPTVGHQELLDIASQVASQEKDGQYLIFPSRTQDKKKNPLDPDTKIAYMQMFYPDHAQNIVNDPNINTIFDVLSLANNNGYSNIKIVSGIDRAKEFEKLSNQYNGQLYQFDTIEVIPAGNIDPDSKSVEGVSSSRMRLAAAEGDFKTFRAGIPSNVKRSDAKELFDVLRGAMNVKEGWETWEIAPKFDFQNLRENYIQENIFKIGELVENLNTGITGRIIRRGTNYLICVTESGQMFKSWIKDLSEYTEVQMNSRMRDSIHPNTLIGTSGAFKYFADMTPGAIGTGEENLQSGGKAYRGYDIKDFINKYRKSRN